MEQTSYIHAYNESYEEPIFPEVGKVVAKLLLKFAKICTILGLVIFIIAYAPSVWYLVSSKYSVSNLIKTTAFLRNPNKSRLEPVVNTEENKPPYQPRTDTSLPAENMLLIPSVGIKTVLNEASTEYMENALKKGVWRVPDFGTPYLREYPTILAAHRYGYLAWSIPYRFKNSFYSLPKLEMGETVEIVWRQRKYVYEVYASDRGEEIKDYSADLILYTCEALNSPVRIFKYARLLEI